MVNLMIKQTAVSWPNNAMVGYIDTTATGSTSLITEDQLANYSVIIFGFTNSDGTVSSGMGDTIDTIRKIQAPNTLNLISIGGAGSTLLLTTDTADNLVDFITNNQLDGIDLDIEDASLSVDSLTTFVDGLRTKLSDDLLLTMSPILAGTPELPTLNIPGGASLEPIYSSIRFDAILVQAYNSGLSFSYPLPSDSTQSVSENSPNIISAAYNSLQQNGSIDPDSKIVIGIPSNAGAANTASNCWNTSDYATIPSVISENLSAIVEEKYDISSDQFGGMMTWSLNADADPNDYPPYSGFENAPAGYFALNVAPILKTL